jgi:hypothetical protein
LTNVNEIANLGWILSLRVSQFERGQLEVIEALGVGAGIFALILFALSLYAWYRRKQPALLIVSSAFLLFFLRHAVELMGEVYETSASLQVLLVLMDFIILLLFFIAVVVRPKRKRQEQMPQQPS